jgi:hypothetical protein
LEAAGRGDAATWSTDAVEPHGPQCAPAGVLPGTASRRVISVAVVDCLYWGVQGNSINNIRVGTYADFFLTEATPMTGLNKGNIYTEFITTHQADDPSGGFHSFVRLVR